MQRCSGPGGQVVINAKGVPGGVDPQGRTSPERLRRPFLLGSFDVVMILIALAFIPDVPLLLRALYAAGLVIVFASSGMYTIRLHLRALARTPRTIGIITVAVMALVTADLLVLHHGLTPDQILRLWGYTAALLLVGRLVASPIHQALFGRARKRRTIIVGSGFAAVLVAEKIDLHPELGLVCVGFVDEGPRRSVRRREEPLLGGIDDITRIIEEMAAEVVIFGYTRNATEDMLMALYKVEPRVEVLMMPRYFQFVSTGMRVDDLAGLPMLRINRVGLTPVERVLKRTEDLVLGGAFSLLVLPLLPVVALAIKLDSPGPVFYKQERIGRNGKPFLMYKFRSMGQGADKDAEALAKLAAEADPRGLKVKADSRVTKLGTFLRKSSIDELPQFINVLKGDMSLVGPRPAVAAEVAAYDEWQKKRLVVAPGITGIWQVNGRSDVAFDERIWLDFMYIDSWSFWLDIGILLQTLPAVLSAKGAY